MEIALAVTPKLNGLLNRDILAMMMLKYLTLVRKSAFILREKQELR
jgi:hypothetical protein